MLKFATRQWLQYHTKKHSVDQCLVRLALFHCPDWFARQLRYLTSQLPRTTGNPLCTRVFSADTLVGATYIPQNYSKQNTIMADTKQQFYSPPPKLGKWEGFKLFLWNSETNQFLGRTAGSWGKLIFFINYEK